jgi:ABC-type uncharacterized transport system involved in gliding motility auxiliary subunit
MSKAGKFLFLFSFLFFLVLCVTRIIYGGWQNGMWGPFVLSIVFFILGVAKDWRGIRELLAQRSTKHGMNMGVMILLVITGLTCLNVLAVRYEKKFDWTSDHLNSLSDQSRKAAQSLRDETTVLVLYRKGIAGQENVGRAVGDLVSMYRNVNAKIKYESYNVLQRPDLAQKYEFQDGAYTVVALQGEKQVKVDKPTEEGLTGAFLKLGRDKKKVFYFTMGHGERVLEDKTEPGLSRLQEGLSAIYDLKPLILFQTQNKVPDDAALVAIVRPNQQFLDSELQAIRDYAKRGGHILMAIDPGLKHNMALLTKSFGVEYANNFILDLRSQIVQGGPAMVLGTEFSPLSEITKSFTSPQTFVIFNMASELKVDPSKAADLKVEPLVSTTTETMSIPEPKEKVSFKPNGPHMIGATVEGKLPEGKEFSAVIFGDSDFISNAYINANLDRDLVMNSVAWLSADKDLISIRPKEPKATKLTMMTQDFYILVVAFLIPFPLLLFFSGGFIWWRRKAA